MSLIDAESVSTAPERRGRRHAHQLYVLRLAAPRGKVQTMTPEANAM